MHMKDVDHPAVKGEENTMTSAEMTVWFIAGAGSGIAEVAPLGITATIVA